MSITNKIKNVFPLLCIPAIVGGVLYFSIRSDIESKREYYSRPVITERGTIVNESYDSFLGYGEYEIVIETEDGKKVIGNSMDKRRDSIQKARTYDNLYDRGDEVGISGRNNEEKAGEFGVSLFLEDMEIGN